MKSRTTVSTTASFVRPGAAPHVERRFDMAAFKLKLLSMILLGEIKSAPNDQVRLCVHNIALSMADRFVQADAGFDREAWYVACGLPKNGFMDFDLSNGYKDSSFGKDARHERVVKIAALSLAKKQAIATTSGDSDLVLAFALDFADTKGEAVIHFASSKLLCLLVFYLGLPCIYVFDRLSI